MPNLSGPQLERLKSRLEETYALRRQVLIKQLTREHPYGATKVSPTQQFANFLAMAPEDYENLIATLNNKYRGLPDAYDRVNRDLADFMAHMIGLMMIQGGQ